MSTTVLNEVGHAEDRSSIRLSIPIFGDDEKGAIAPELIAYLRPFARISLSRSGDQPHFDGIITSARLPRTGAVPSDRRHLGTLW